MSDYTLYSHRNSYAMSVHLMLEELGVDYDVVLFNVHVEAELPEEFLQLNPNARVPTLVTADGPIYESAAILVHLSEKHGGRFMPTFSDPLRGKFWQWLFYLMSTLQPEVLIQFHPERYFPDDGTMQQALCKASLLELDKIWFIIDDALRPGPYFLAEKYSVCDMLFAMQALWTENQPADLSAYPNTVKLMEQVFKRPAARKILQAHSIEHLALF
jgi:glutathione S-transferase